MNGPQMDIPVGGDGLHNNGPNWSGLTIKEILEKVDLFNVTVEEDPDKSKNEKVLVGKAARPSKTKGTVINASDPGAAFLGPKLWDKPIAMQPFMDDNEFSIMNIDDFLNENNISLDDEESRGTDHDSLMSNSSPEPSYQQDRSPIPSTTTQSRSQNALPKDTPTDFLYAESKRAKAERERAERKRKLEMDVEFAPEDLALATIPGANFDPRKRSFSMEELKPQPIIRKRKKHFVPCEAKDDRYWEKRVKNNMAARRSREARRLKENQIALRAAFLEKENATLKARLDEMTAMNAKLESEKASLRERLTRYEIA